MRKRISFYVYCARLRDLEQRRAVREACGGESEKHNETMYDSVVNSLQSNGRDTFFFWPQVFHPSIMSSAAPFRRTAEVNDSLGKKAAAENESTANGDAAEKAKNSTPSQKSETKV